jgi:hypothetical protein
MNFFFNDTATTEIYTLSLHDALPIFGLEQGHAYFTQHVRNIAFCDARLPADVFDEAGEFVGKG